MSYNSNYTKICRGSNCLSVYKLTIINPLYIPTLTSTLPVAKPLLTNICISVL